MTKEKKSNVVKLPSHKLIIERLARENIDIILEGDKKIEAAIIAFRYENDITIFTTKYSAELIGLLELAKLKIMDGMLTYDEDDEND